ncbi:insulinase family protein [Aliamphritea ceti]|uniref:insulinase family protein n=1 Tax=Aliamphritea ceti TaxID=1524258 RepID=UPI0021C39871|nr:insulinase family protein [Aliamphritea ceti]
MHQASLRHIFTGCLILALSSVTSSIALANETSAQTDNAIIKSPNDERLYRSFTLPNQMKVLVVSDPEADKAAASLDVNAGSNANPPGREGLAHFLEHMLFLGTEKYPEAGSYKAFISANGGNQNAYTAYPNTNYFFDIAVDQLEPALDRFAQFFISPTFDEAYVDRERQAVFSEYQSKLKDDSRRTLDAYKQVMNPEHPYAQFSVGDLNTLSNDNPGQLRQELIAFYERYYSANLMSLVVLGKQPLDQLETMVREKFSAVINHESEAPQSELPLFTTEQLPAQLTIRPLKELQQLRLSFPLPPTRQLYNQKPLFYLASMLGYEGKNSLLSELKRQGLANSLYVFQGTDLNSMATLDISIDLTQSGLSNMDTVVEQVFASIELLRDSGIREDIYREEKRLGEQGFRFKEKGGALGYVSSLSRRLQLYPTASILDVGYSMNDFQPELIADFATHLTPENMLLTLLDSNAETDKVSPWYQTPYSIKAISKERLNHWIDPKTPAGLENRTTNPFIAENLDLKATEKAVAQPVKLIDQAGATLWYQQDQTFNLPKTNTFISLFSPAANTDPRARVLTSMTIQMIREQLSETLYDAGLAGIGGQVYSHLRGFGFRITGYNDKQETLLKHIVAAFDQPQFDPVSFERIKQKYLEQLQNSAKNKPYDQTIDEIYNDLMPRWRAKDKLAALNDITLDELNQHALRLIENSSIRMLSHGNVSQSEAESMLQIVEKGLTKRQANAAETPITIDRLDASKPRTTTLDLEHNDSAISIYFQGKNNDLSTRAAYTLLGEIIEAPFYTSLRTEQQLGYVVFATPLQMLDVPGMAFVIQSPNSHPDKIAIAVDEFLQNMQLELANMTDEQFSTYKRSVLSRINQKETSLYQLTGRYWQEIDRKEYGFNSREKLSQSISSLTLEDIQKALKDLPQRRLTVESIGSNLLALKQQS